MDKDPLKFFLVYGAPVRYELLDGDAQGGGYALELGKPGLTFSKLILLNCTRCGSRLFGYFLLCHPGFFPGRFYAFASGHAFTSCG